MSLLKVAMNAFETMLAKGKLPKLQTLAGVAEYNAKANSTPKNVVKLLSSTSPEYADYTRQTMKGLSGDAWKAKKNRALASFERMAEYDGSAGKAKPIMDYPGAPHISDGGAEGPVDIRWSREGNFLATKFHRKSSIPGISVKNLVEEKHNLHRDARKIQGDASGFARTYGYNLTPVKPGKNRNIIDRPYSAMEYVPGAMGTDSTAHEMTLKRLGFKKKQLVNPETNALMGDAYFHHEGKGVLVQDLKADNFVGGKVVDPLVIRGRQFPINPATGASNEFESRLL